MGLLELPSPVGRFLGSPSGSLVRKAGFEPARVAPRDPKSRASTGSATSAARGSVREGAGGSRGKRTAADSARRPGRPSMTGAGSTTPPRLAEAGALARGRPDTRGTSRMYSPSFRGRGQGRMTFSSPPFRKSGMRKTSCSPLRSTSVAAFSGTTKASLLGGVNPSPLHAKEKSPWYTTSETSWAASSSRRRLSASTHPGRDRRPRSRPPPAAGRGNEPTRSAAGGPRGESGSSRTWRQPSQCRGARAYGRNPERIGDHGAGRSRGAPSSANPRPFVGRPWGVKSRTGPTAPSRRGPRSARPS